MALAVPLSRFTSQVGGGSAFFVRQHYTFMKDTFFYFFIIMLIMVPYWWRRERAAGRRGVRWITGYGFVFCILSFNLWAATQLDDITAIHSGEHGSWIYSTPWLWISALCVGVALLVISFFTRVRHDHAA